MRALLEDKLVETHRRAIEEPAVWRLSLDARKAANVTRRPVFLKSYKVPHFLGIADALIWLLLSGKLDPRFVVEPRIKFRLRSEERVFPPDLAFVWNGQPYYLEYQPSKLSPSGWRDKWKKREPFFTHQVWKELGFAKEPVVIALTDQEASKVKTGCTYPLRVLKDISQIGEWSYGRD